MEEYYRKKGKNGGNRCEHFWEYGHHEKISPAGKYWDSYRKCQKCGAVHGVKHNRFIHDR